jgi:hypothetical protein
MKDKNLEKNKNWFVNETAEAMSGASVFTEGIFFV